MDQSKGCYLSYLEEWMPILLADSFSFYRFVWWQLLGRSIDLAFLIGQRMNKIFRENLDFLFERFEAHDLCTIVVLDLTWSDFQFLWASATGPRFFWNSFKLFLNALSLLLIQSHDLRCWCSTGSSTARRHFETHPRAFVRACEDGSISFDDGGDDWDHLSRIFLRTSCNPGYYLTQPLLEIKINTKI